MIVDVLILRSFVILCSSFSPSFLCSPVISGLPVLAELTWLIPQLFFFITEHFIFLDELFILILNFLREILELFLSFFPLSLVDFVFVLQLFQEVLALGSHARSPAQHSAGPTQQRELKFLSLSLSLQLSLSSILFSSVSVFTFPICACTSSHNTPSEKKHTGSEMVLQYQMKDIFSTFAFPISLFRYEVPLSSGTDREHPFMCCTRTKLPQLSILTVDFKRKISLKWF